jgi:hypothetical protein
MSCGYIDYYICEKCGHKTSLPLSSLKKMPVIHSWCWKLDYVDAQCKKGKRISLWEFITMSWDCRAK